MQIIIDNQTVLKGDLLSRKILTLVNCVRASDRYFVPLTKLYLVYVWNFAKGDLDAVSQARATLWEALPDRAQYITQIYNEVVPNLKNLAIWQADKPIEDGDIAVFDFVSYSDKTERAQFSVQDFSEWLINALNVSFIDNKIAYFNGYQYVTGVDAFLKIIKTVLSVVKAFTPSLYKILYSQKETNDFISNFIASNCDYIKVKTNPYYIPTKNGIVHLKQDNRGAFCVDSCTLESFSPDKASTFLLNANFNPKANSSIFDDWIDLLTNNNKALRAVLAEMCGVAIFNKSFCKKFFYLYSVPNGGKSTFLNTLRELLGASNVSNVDLRNASELKFKLSKIDGMLVNITDEASDNGNPYSKLTCDVIKKVTGFGVLQVEDKNVKAYDINPTATLIFASNDRPTFADTGVFSRLIAIPFLHTFKTSSAPDYTKITEVMDAFLMFALDGLCRVLNRDKAHEELFTTCKETTELKQEIGLQNDPIKEFIETYQGTPEEFLKWCQYNPSAEEEGKYQVVARVFAHYKNWIKDQNYNPKFLFTETIFYHRVCDYFPQLLRDKSNNTRKASIHANDLSYTGQFAPAIDKQKKWSVFSIKQNRGGDLCKAKSLT